MLFLSLMACGTDNIDIGMFCDLIFTTVFTLSLTDYYRIFFSSC